MNSPTIIYFDHTTLVSDIVPCSSNVLFVHRACHAMSDEFLNALIDDKTTIFHYFSDWLDAANLYDQVTDPKGHMVMAVYFSDAQCLNKPSPFKHVVVWIYDEWLRDSNSRIAHLPSMNLSRDFFVGMGNYHDEKLTMIKEWLDIDPVSKIMIDFYENGTVDFPKNGSPNRLKSSPLFIILCDSVPTALNAHEYLTSHGYKGILLSFESIEYPNSDSESLVSGVLICQKTLPLMVDIILEYSKVCDSMAVFFSWMNTVPSLIEPPLNEQLFFHEWEPTRMSSLLNACFQSLAHFFSIPSTLLDITQLSGVIFNTPSSKSQTTGDLVKYWATIPHRSQQAVVSLTSIQEYWCYYIFTLLFTTTVWDHQMAAKIYEASRGIDDGDSDCMQQLFHDLSGMSHYSDNDIIHTIFSKMMMVRQHHNAQIIINANYEQIRFD